MKIQFFFTIITTVTISLQGMHTLTELPDDALFSMVAQANGKTKTCFAKICKKLHGIASFLHRDRLLRHRSIYLGPLEKHLLLYEYTCQGAQAMVKLMFSLGAHYDVLSVFGDWHESLPRNILDQTEYVPRSVSEFPRNRIPYACINNLRTLLHIAVLKRQYTIAKTILEEVKLEIIKTAIDDYNSDYVYVNKKAFDFINAQDKHGNTPLHLAIANGDLTMALVLLSYRGLNPKVERIFNCHGLDPLTCAEYVQYTHPQYAPYTSMLTILYDYLDSMKENNLYL